MEHITVIAAIGVAILIVGSIFCVYQLYRLVQTDAVCRGLKHPKLWGFIASSGNNQSGIILYLIGRKRHPIISISDEQKQTMEKCKRKFGVGLLFIVIGAILCILSITILN